MSLNENKLSLEDLIDNVKADIKELYDRMGRHTTYLEVGVLNVMEFENRVRRSIEDARIKHDRR